MTDNIKPASPYKTLGVAKTAGKEEIRAAFKTLAKKHHPDVAGGENDTFNRIKAAYDLLMDDKARKLYDDFGVIPGDDASQLRMQATQAVLNMFGQLLSEVDINALESTDIFGLLKTHIGKQISRVEKEIAEVRESEKGYRKALEILNKRLTCEKGKKNIFIDVLEGQITQAPGIIAMKERERRVFQEMLSILKDYRFDFEQQRIVSTCTSTMSASTSTLRWA